jgi:hypothetical protein
MGTVIEKGPPKGPLLFTTESVNGLGTYGAKHFIRIKSADNFLPIVAAQGFLV